MIYVSTCVAYQHYFRLSSSLPHNRRQERHFEAERVENIVIDNVNGCDDGRVGVSLVCRCGIEIFRFLLLCLSMKFMTCSFDFHRGALNYFQSLFACCCLFYELTQAIFHKHRLCSNDELKWTYLYLILTTYIVPRGYRFQRENFSKILRA